MKCKNQELRLNLVKAYAEWEKAYAEREKANAELDKVDAESDKTFVEWVNNKKPCKCGVC